MRDRLKSRSVMTKWWLWKHRHSSQVPNPFCVCPRGTRRTLFGHVLMTPSLQMVRTKWSPKTWQEYVNGKRCCWKKWPKMNRILLWTDGCGTKSEQRYGTRIPQPFHRSKRVCPSTSGLKCRMIRYHRLLSGTNCTDDKSSLFGFKYKWMQMSDDTTSDSYQVPTVRHVPEVESKQGRLITVNLR